MTKYCFTLVELLIAIAIVSLLAAILLPAFFFARRHAQSSQCISNLRQIGVAVSLYAQDYDEIVPLGGDAVDLDTNLWDGGPYWQQDLALQPLQNVLYPYTKSDAVWDCPLDTGFNNIDLLPASIQAHPSSYSEFGLSYLYRTEFAFRHEALPSLVLYDYGDLSPGGAPAIVESSSVNLLQDSSGLWHGTRSQPTYNVLMADGHVKNLSKSAMDSIWAMSVAPYPSN